MIITAHRLLRYACNNRFKMIDAVYALLSKPKDAKCVLHDLLRILKEKKLPNAAHALHLMQLITFGRGTSQLAAFFRREFTRKRLMVIRRRMKDATLTREDIFILRLMFECIAAIRTTAADNILRQAYCCLGANKYIFGATVEKRINTISAEQVSAYSNEYVLDMIRDGDISRLKASHRNGAILNVSSTVGLAMPAIMCSVMPVDTKVMLYLLDNGVDINAKDSRGNTALIFAAMWGDVKIIHAKLLINKGADVDACNGDGLTARDICNKARSCARRSKMKLLLSMGR